MEIVLGYELDTGSYPDALLGEAARVGMAVLGPERLVSVLETRLGLSGPLTHHAVHIGQYLKCMKDANNGNRFYSQSLASDAWSTAKAVLAWRDELILAGWKGQEIAAAGIRLQDIHEVEKRAAGLVAPGLGERLQAVATALQTQSLADIQRIRLVDRLQLWPPCWQKLLKILQAQGVALQEETLPHADGNTCLDSLKQAMRERKDTEAGWVFDGTLGILRSNTEWEAAEVMASWLHALPEDRSKRLLIIRGKGSPLLDGVFQSHGHPGLGWESRARWRAALQVLPLVLSNLWAPFDPQRLLELLTLPQLPFSSAVASRFERALRSHPGKGGPYWQEAMVYGSGKVSNLDLWLGNHSCNRTSGAKAADVLGICDMVSAWAAKQGGMDNDSFLLAVSGVVQSVSEAVVAAGLPLISPAQLDRILDSTVGEGIEDPDAVPRAAAWSQVASPGQVFGSIEKIIWWNFVRPETNARRLPWTKDDLAALNTVGVELEPPSQARRREAEAWRRPVHCAGSQLFFVVPGTLDGNDELHPLWDEIRHLLNLGEPDIARLTVDASTVRNSGQPTVFGNILGQVPIVPVPLPAPCHQWPIAHPHHCVRPNAPESFSSMEKLIQCPFAWVLNYILGIRTGELISLPEGGQMIGTLTHAIIEELFSRSGTMSASAARAQTEQLYDTMVPQMAVTLLHPGRELERLRYRKAIAEGVEHLVNFLNAGQLVVAGCEVSLSKPLPAGTATMQPSDQSIATSKTFSGRIDLVLARNGQTGFLTKNENDLQSLPPGALPMFMDIKWTRSAKRRVEEIEQGRSLQLAAYSWLLSKTPHGFPPGGYYLLPKGDALFSPCHNLPAQFPNPSLDLGKVWDAALVAYHHRVGEIAGGVARAEGIPQPPSSPADTGTQGSGQAPQQRPTTFTLEPPCTFCDYGNLCGKREG